MIEWKVLPKGRAAGGNVRVALVVAKPVALLIVTKTALVKERPGTKFRSFSTSG